MSNDVFSAVKRRVVGSPTAKAVLLLMADNASDDGTGIWTSKGNLARDLEMGKRTVQMAIQSLIDIGVVKEVGQKPCKNGFTVEYRIDLKALIARPSTRAADAPVTRAGDAPVQEMHPYPCSSRTPTRAGDAPKPPLEPPLEPSIARDGLFDALEEPKSKDDGFEDFWRAYPRKEAKAAARKNWAKAIQKAPASVIIAAAERYSQRPVESVKFLKFPQGWLTDERWRDEEQAPSDRRARFQPPSHEEVFR
jgi:hypothetical protein